MGFRYITANHNYHTDDFNMCIKTKSVPVIATKRQKSETVQGRDGQYIFEDGYNNVQLTFGVVIESEEIIDRRKTERQIASWLSATGTLILDYEADIEYDVVKVTNDIDTTIVGYSLPINQFDVIFECRPIQKQTYYNDSFTWDEATMAWKYAGIPWDGYPRTFEGVVDTDVLEVINAGTYKALPIIKLSGTATTVTVGSFTFTNLSGDIYVDCDNKLVYSISGGNKVNELSSFTGDFIELAPGTNEITVTGTITSLDIEFDYKNTYL